MTYRFSGVTNTTYIVIKHFSNTEKTFSQNFGTIAHMWHIFLCLIILAKWRFCRNFDPLIFTLFLLHLGFATLFLHFFLFQCLSFLPVKQKVLRNRGPFFARKKKFIGRIPNLGYSWENTAGIL